MCQEFAVRAYHSFCVYAVFSHTEQIGALRFVVALLLFCLLFVDVDPKLIVDVGPEFISIFPPSNIR